MPYQKKELHKFKTLVLTLKHCAQYQVTITQFRNSVHLLISLFLCFIHPQNEEPTPLKIPKNHEIYI